jgi:hypothetical protein
MSYDANRRLDLTKEEAQEKYDREWPPLNKMLEDATARGGDKAAKRARQLLSRLSDECHARLEEEQEDLEND